MLETLLAGKKSAIMEGWFQRIVETYPSDTAAFLKKEKNQFANPVGNAIAEGVEHLFETVVFGPQASANSSAVPAEFENIIRIRAVQEFPPSQAVGFLFLLKGVIRESLGEDIHGDGISAELAILDARIDSLTARGFDIYMQCREKLYDLKAEEIKRRSFKLLQRAELIVAEDRRDEEPEDTLVG